MSLNKKTQTLYLLNEQDENVCAFVAQQRTQHAVHAKANVLNSRPGNIFRGAKACSTGELRFPTISGNGFAIFRFLPRGCSSAAIHVNRHIIHDEANELLHIRYVTQPAALIIAYNDYLVLAPRDLRLVYE